MRCYKCNSVLSETNFCNSCGCDVTLYKKIVRMSNTYYNMGLAKARVRDLSGAADLLRRSVRIDKHNINARNLLGLVYYEMGEYIAAFSEWVISKNLKAEKNIADTYLQDVQSNPAKLGMMNQSIKKYNHALESANQGSFDMAIIQLKKVLNMNPKFLKAQHLLALLHMQNGDDDKAMRILLKAAKIDVNNTLTLKYMEEINQKKAAKSGAKRPAKSVAELNERDELSGNDVIIPKSGYKDVNYGLLTFVNVVVGIVIGAAMVFFLVTPAKQSNIDAKYKNEINGYSDQVAMLNINISELEGKIKTITAEKDALQKQLDEVDNVEIDTKNYEKLIAAASKLQAKDLIGCADNLYEVDVDKLASPDMIALYNSLKAESFGKAGEHYNNIAYQSYNSGDYANALLAFEKSTIFTPDDVGIWYNLGKCYKAQNGGSNNEKSVECFEKVIEMAPESEYAGWAKSQKK